MLTPLALALILIDVMDLIFAVDSIPAVFAITQDPFIVYTSNICAIVGLRSLYFLVARMMDRFIYLRIGLAFVLGFVGIKMIFGQIFSRADSDLPRHHRTHSRSHHRYFDVEDAEPGCNRRPKISIAFALWNHLTGFERL